MFQHGIVGGIDLVRELVEEIGVSVVMKKNDFKTKPVLEGKKVILRPFQIEDGQLMLKFMNDPEIRYFTGSDASDEDANTPISEEESAQILEWYKTRNEKDDRLDLAIIDKENHNVVGEVVFNEYDEDTQSVNFRILIGEKGRGKGLGTEATELFIQYGFETLALQRIELEVYSFNPRAEMVYQKVGFILEGVKRKNFKYNEELFDTRFYAMLNSDYQKLNRGF